MGSSCGGKNFYADGMARVSVSFLIQFYICTYIYHPLVDIKAYIMDNNERSFKVNEGQLGQ